jgi:hypothetical protein
VKIESTRLLWQRVNQETLRADSYKGLQDYVSSTAAAKGIPAGKTIVLSSSFPGGPRAMQQSYQDAMAICREHGKADIFLTITTNPKAPDIIKNLGVNQTASDRPDIVARIFKLILDELLDDLLVKQIFGKIDAYVYTIEFQKRGLPHCHMLLILDQEDKITTLEKLNRLISCEIPDPEKNPRLSDAVRLLMIHGPCGELNPLAPCMENGKCGKGFPKDFCEESSLNVNGFAQYMRPNNGRTLDVRGCQVDNRWVVAHNPHLLLKYNAHINVEMCATVKSFKYLYKYIFKGQYRSFEPAVFIPELYLTGRLFLCFTGYDKARIAFRTINGKQETVFNVDEISEFVDSRYISPPEAVWRILQFEMQAKSHSVVRLPVTLPGQESVYFLTGQEEEAIDQATGRKNHLSAWFELNGVDPEASKVLYADIPLHYSWIPKERRWKRRVRGEKVIGRMYTVSPSDMERFCLRLLLLHTPGATSFEFLRTANGELHQTFHAAALSRELLEDDNEWISCLDEASRSQMPSAVRALFAVILLCGPPANCVVLWDQFQETFIEDYSHRGLSAAAAVFQAYHEINRILHDSGKRRTLADFGIPIPPSDGVEIIPDVTDRKVLAERGDVLYKGLFPGQKLVVDEVLSAVRYSPAEHNCYFFDGPGGTGKTRCYETIFNVLEGEGREVIMVAWTGKLFILNFTK